VEADALCWMSKSAAVTTMGGTRTRCTNSPATLSAGALSPSRRHQQPVSLFVSHGTPHVA
jgi:hypothetical protein